MVFTAGHLHGPEQPRAALGVGMRWKERWREWWHRARVWWADWVNSWRTLRLAKRIPELQEPSAKAMYKVYCACPHIPPDTISAGIQNGGQALFFRHKGVTEIFIHQSYDQAAIELIAWIKAQRDTLDTSNSQMNRVQRRAYAAHFKRKAKKRGHVSKS